MRRVRIAPSLPGSGNSGRAARSPARSRIQPQTIFVARSFWNTSGRRRRSRADIAVRGRADGVSRCGGGSARPRQLSQDLGDLTHQFSGGRRCCPTRPARCATSAASRSASRTARALTCSRSPARNRLPGQHQVDVGLDREPLRIRNALGVLAPTRLGGRRETEPAVNA